MNSLEVKSSQWGLPRMGIAKNNETKAVQSPKMTSQNNEPIVHGAKKIEKLAKRRTTNTVPKNTTKRPIPEASDEEESNISASIQMQNPNELLRLSLPEFSEPLENENGLVRK